MGTRLLLCQREAGAGLAAIVNQPLDQLVVFLIHQIHHELLGPPQEAGQAEWSLIRAAHDEHMVANPLSQQPGGFQPNRQPSILPRVRKLQLINVPQIPEDGFRLIHNGGVPFPEDDFRPTCLCQRGIIKINHAAVVAILFLADHLCLHHPGSAIGHFAHLDSGSFRREHERLRHHRHPIGNPASKNRLASLKTCNIAHNISSDFFTS